jgi:hypothetical protein
MAHSVSLKRCPPSQACRPPQTVYRHDPRHARGAHRGGQRCGLVSVGFASREFLSWSLISRQVKSSVYVGEKVSDFTQPMRSAAGNVDQFLVISSRVRWLARETPCHSLTGRLAKCNRACGATALGYIPAWDAVGYGGTGPTCRGVVWTKRDAECGSGRNGNN